MHNGPAENRRKDNPDAEFASRPNGEPGQCVRDANIRRGRGLGEVVQFVAGHRDSKLRLGRSLALHGQNGDGAVLIDRVGRDGGEEGLQFGEGGGVVGKG
jgi:hypothetical protein